MKKVIIFILTLSLTISSFSISTYDDKTNNVYSITTNNNFENYSDQPIIPTNNH